VATIRDGRDGDDLYATYSLEMDESSLDSKTEAEAYCQMGNNELEDTGVTVRMGDEHDSAANDADVNCTSKTVFYQDVINL